MSIDMVISATNITATKSAKNQSAETKTVQIDTQEHANTFQEIIIASAKKNVHMHTMKTKTT